MPTFIHDDHQLFYREEGSGPLLLLLPGNTASSANVIGELAYFGQRFHTVALDFWGTGQSARLEPWPENWWEVGARDAAALIEHLGEERAFVIGTSGGAIVALLLALHYPERVGGVIADSTVERLTKASIKTAVDGRAERTPEQIAFWSAAHGDDWEAVVEADSDMLLRFVKKMRGDWAQGRLSEIACPVLLTASLEDPLLPRVGKQIMSMSKQIPNSRAFLTGGGGHPLMWSRPEDFRRVADYFLMRVQEVAQAQAG
ncbi:MAG: alpha/beta fold hydrolase [Caldilineaceae bacterium]|nr:alpha/beta fold hydrolase [Caldilineaceae bacterium]